MTDGPWWRFHTDDGEPPPGASAGRADADALRAQFSQEPEPSGPLDPAVWVAFEQRADRWSVTHWTAGNEYTVRHARRLDRALVLAHRIGPLVRLDDRGHRIITEPTPDEANAVAERVLRERALPHDARVRELAGPARRRRPAGALRVDTFHSGADGAPGPWNGSWHVTGATRDEVLRWLGGDGFAASWARIDGDPDTDPVQFWEIPHAR